MRDWTIENVPRSFWDAIETAGGDPEKFRPLAMTLPREQLRRLFDQYIGLAEHLLTRKHVEALGGQVSEDAASDIACWVVMQGEQFYCDVFEDPSKTPTRDQVRRSVAGVIVEVFADRFGEWV